MDAIRDIIPLVIAPLSQGKNNFTDLSRQWQMLTDNAKTSVAVSFKEGCLTIHVDCAARVVRMGHDKANYLQALGKNNPLIKDIKFKVGKI